MKPWNHRLGVMGNLHFTFLWTGSIEQSLNIFNFVVLGFRKRFRFSIIWCKNKTRTTYPKCFMFLKTFEQATIRWKEQKYHKHKNNEVLNLYLPLEIRWSLASDYWTLRWNIYKIPSDSTETLLSNYLQRSCKPRYYISNRSALHNFSFIQTVC
jgi:hypothetical protein